MSAPEAPATSAPTPAMGNLARGSMANLVGAFVTAGTTLLLTVAVTHAESRKSAGIFFSTTSLFLLAITIGQLGTNTGVVYFISRDRAVGRSSRIHAYVRTSLRPVLITGVVLGALVFAFARPMSELLNPGHVGQSEVYLKLLALFIPLAGIENVYLSASRGLGAMRANVVVEQMARPVLQLVLVTAALTVNSSGALALGWVFGYLPAAVAASWWWRRSIAHLPEAEVEVEDSVPAASREFWRFTAPRALASVAQIAMQRLDIVLVGALAGAVAAAVYTASTRFLVVGQMGNRAISLAVQPRLSRALSQDDHRRATHLYQVSTAWLILITWPLYLMFVVFGRELLAIFGRGYNGGSQVLLLLSLTMLVATACGMVDIVLTMAGRTSWNLYNVLLSMGVQLTLDVILIPRIGIIGAAIGWAAAIATGNLVPLTQVAVAMKVHPFGRATATAGVIALACFGLVPLLVRLALGLTWFAILVSLVVGGALFVVTCWRLRESLELMAFAEMRSRRGADGGQDEAVEPAD